VERVHATMTPHKFSAQFDRFSPLALSVLVEKGDWSATATGPGKQILILRCLVLVSENQSNIADRVD
jgi:hypothetical protein